MSAEENTYASAASPQSAPAFSLATKRKVVSGLQIAIFVAAIDSTLVAVALLSIARELGGASLIAWVIAGYTVAATVATPVYGSLSDQYGRQRMMTIAILLYLLGCVGCIASQSMTQMMFCRIVQGLGGGGILVLSQSAIADVVQPNERGKYQAWLSGTYALAALLGPVTGGYLTAWFGWRFAFASSVPLALLALLLTGRILGVLPKPAQRERLDYTSVLLLAVGIASVLIALTRIGQGASLTDLFSILLLAVGGLALIGFWRRQAWVKGPIFAPEVLNNPMVRVSCLSSCLVYFGLIGGAVMLPLALQTLAGHTPDEVAQKMLMHALSIPCGAFFSGRLMPRGMRYRLHILIGTTLSAICATALALLPMTAAIPVALAMIGMGLGIGIALPPGIVATQSAVPSNRVGAATAFMGLSRSFGSAVGLAILTSVLFASLGRNAGAGSSNVAGGPAGLLLEKGAAADPSLALGFSLVFASMAAGFVCAALAASRLPARHQPAGVSLPARHSSN